MKSYLRDTTISNYIEYLVLFLTYFGATGLIMYGADNLPVFLALTVVTAYLAIYKHEVFLYLALTVLVTREVFVFQQEYLAWGEGGGFGKGDLYLKALRVVHPQKSVLYANYPKVLFVSALFKILATDLWDKSKGLFTITKMDFLVFFFLFLSLASVAANLAFNGGTLNFYFTFLFPIVIYYYFKSVDISFEKQQRLFNYMMFLFLEVQIFFTLLNNFGPLKRGIFIFMDDAVGTFVYPRYESSSYLLAITFFVHLYYFLIEKKIITAVKAAVALMGILSASVLLFTALLSAFSVIVLIYLFITGSLKSKDFALALIFSVALIPVFKKALLDEGTGELPSGTEHIEKYLERINPQSISNIPKIYSYVNLMNMIREEEKFFFGSGPGTFLTRFAKGPLNVKYGSINIYQTTQLSSSDRLENSIVGLLGEVGFVAGFIYLAFYGMLIKQINRDHKLWKKFAYKPNPFYLAVITVVFFYFAIAAIRNSIERYFFSMTIMYLIVLAENYASHSTALFLGLSKNDGSDKLD